MKLQRFFLKQRIGDEDEIAVVELDLTHQLTKVFRFHVGDAVILFDGSGFEYAGEIISLSNKEVIFKILNRGEGKNNDRNVSLYLSVIKKNNFELATEKCTEIGVSEIHPILSERSEKKGLNLERLNKIAKEASEQCGRATLPSLFEVTNLSTAVSQAINDGKFCIVFHTGKTDCLTPERKDETLAHFNTNKIAVFIGPEGGWTEDEIKLLRENKFFVCSLGHNILRAETAAIAAVWEAFHRE